MRPASDPTSGGEARLPRLLYSPEARAIAFQILFVAILALLFYEMAANVALNLRKQNVASGFDFLGRTSGFDISQKLIAYENTSSFGRAFLVGLLNTILVSAIGIVLATLLGFALGIARLSHSWLVSRLAQAYVETVRNVPLLLQLLIWYFAVLRSLPMPLESHDLPLGAYLNRRGLFVPWPEAAHAVPLLFVLLTAGAVAAFIYGRRQRARDLEAGTVTPGLAVKQAGLALGPGLLWLLIGPTTPLSYPAVGRWNVEGGLAVLPEFAALLIGLTVYTAAFIAEIVRAGIQGVAKGQSEAALALGLSRRQTLRLVVIPQALRIIVPPLTNQYLNLTKNSSLAVAIGYPDLVSVFSGTVLNLSNQAVEVILITMAVYLTLSLFTAFAMNRFNARIQMERR